MTRAPADPRLLAQLPPFSWLTETQLAWALPATEHRSYSTRTTIIRAGDKAEGLYIVLSGRVKVLHEDGQGHELLAEVVGPKEFFGELGLFDGTDCPVTIESDGACELVFVPRKLLLECLEDNPRAAMSMLRASVSRLCATHRKLGTVALTSVGQRVATVLLENGAEVDGEWHVGVGSEAIATMVGASREMVSRVVKGLIVAGIMRRSRRRLIVCDRDALAARVRSPASASEPSN